MTRRLLFAVMVLALVITATNTSTAAPKFLQGKTQYTVTSLLYPWTQDDSCPCCVCWSTAVSTVLDYWNQNTNDGEGPWRKLVPNGLPSESEGFLKASQTLFDVSGKSCGVGASNAWSWFFASDMKVAGKAYSNDSLGYDFDYDEDTWVWFDNDIADEIDAHRPLVYAYGPEGDGAHAVTVVGYDASNEMLYLYKNWFPEVSLRGFDDADYHMTLNVTPEGEDVVPNGWQCAAESYDTQDGCHCDCGIPDPDCDIIGSSVLNCSAGQTCSSQGACETPCQDVCTEGHRACADSLTQKQCQRSPTTGCTTWQMADSCLAGQKCEQGICIAPPAPAPNPSPDDGTGNAVCQQGARSCGSTTEVRVCDRGGQNGELNWQPLGDCPQGSYCLKGQCTYENSNPPGSGLSPQGPQTPGVIPPTTGGCHVADDSGAPTPLLSLLLCAFLALRAIRSRRAIRRV